MISNLLDENPAGENTREAQREHFMFYFLITLLCRKEFSFQPLQYYHLKTNHMLIGASRIGAILGEMYMSNSYD